MSEQQHSDSSLREVAAGTRRIESKSGSQRYLGGTRRMFLGLGAVAALGATTTALGLHRGAGGAQAASPAAASVSAAQTLRLGFFANLTHAPALIGVSRGVIAAQLKTHDTRFVTQVFNAGPDTIEALSAGAIDAAYLGPSPAVNSFVKSKGRSLNIIAGATSGGASLVVHPRFTSVAELVAAPSLTLADPQLGGTQDVALRTWVQAQGLKLVADGGTVAINPVANAQTLALFKQGRLDGAWLPEPWGSALVAAGARRLVDERDLWPAGQFPATVLVVNRDFAAKYPQTVRDLAAANQTSIAWLNDPANTTHIAAEVTRALAAHGAKLDIDILNEALRYLSFGSDPLEKTYATLLQHAVAAGLAKPVAAAALTGIVNIP